MPIENMEEEGLQKVPNLDIAQVKFQLQHCNTDAGEKKRLRDELMTGTIVLLLQVHSYFILEFRTKFFQK